MTQQNAVSERLWECMLHSPSKEADQDDYDSLQVAIRTFIGYDTYNDSCSPPKVNLRGSRWSSGSSGLVSFLASSSLPLSLGTSFSSPRPTLFSSSPTRFLSFRGQDEGLKQG